MNNKSQSSKLIFINRYFYPDHSATSQMLSDLAFGLAKTETTPEIHIVTSRQRYDDASANLPGYQIIQNVHVHRIATTRFGRQNLFGRAIDYLSFYISSFLTLISITNTGDTLIAKTDPPLISIIAALVAKLKRAQLINWLQDLFPEVAAQLGVKLATGFPYTILKALRNQTLKQAKINVAIGDLMAERLRKEGIPDNQITVIHNWADEDQLQPVPHEQNSLRTQWGLQGKFVVGYSGNLGRSHDFSTILQAAAELKDNQNIVFLIIGGGAQLAQVQKECIENNLNNVIFKPYQPRERLSESLSAADVHLITLKPELEGLIVPSKFYGVLAAGRPMIFIGAEHSELATVIKRARCGDTVLQLDVDALVTAISQHYNQLNTDKTEHIRAIFDTKYAKSNAIAQFKKMFHGS